jgi:hypothetical protein
MLTLLLVTPLAALLTLVLFAVSRGALDFEAMLFSACHDVSPLIELDLQTKTPRGV